ncbi:hypothetical protein LshimejAT787_0410980 [Lyophyllum shimeji]|uniref:Uncharacterized protein n=1 Tax=Lyophyllum shimeji TaxID=47721 RepID=A0A9P3PKN9_LYOSH|nr:hypothetical protein LshimejAT787_0410980 [Lyophyllum shimeji]
MYSTRATSGSRPLIPPASVLSPPAPVLSPPAAVLTPPDSSFLHRRIPDSRLIVAPQVPHVTIQFLQGKGSLDLFSLDLPLPASSETRKLLAALRGETGCKPYLKKASNLMRVARSEDPVMFSEAPPVDSAQTNGFCLYLNGTITSSGVPRKTEEKGRPSSPSTPTIRRSQPIRSDEAAADSEDEDTGLRGARSKRCNTGRQGQVDSSDYEDENDDDDPFFIAPRTKSAGAKSKRSGLPRKKAESAKGAEEKRKTGDMMGKEKKKAAQAVDEEQVGLGAAPPKTRPKPRPRWKTTSTPPQGLEHTATASFASDRSCVSSDPVGMPTSTAYGPGPGPALPAPSSLSSQRPPTTTPPSREASCGPSIASNSSRTPSNAGHPAETLPCPTSTVPPGWALPVGPSNASNPSRTPSNADHTSETLPRPASTAPPGWALSASSNVSPTPSNVSAGPAPLMQQGPATATTSKRAASPTPTSRSISNKASNADSVIPPPMEKPRLAASSAAHVASAVSHASNAHKHKAEGAGMPIQTQHAPHGRPPVPLSTRPPVPRPLCTTFRAKVPSNGYDGRQPRARHLAYDGRNSWHHDRQSPYYGLPYEPAHNGRRPRYEDGALSYDGAPPPPLREDGKYGQSGQYPRCLPSTRLGAQSDRSHGHGVIGRSIRHREPPACGMTEGLRF